jgi:hypothetical protein
VRGSEAAVPAAPVVWCAIDARQSFAGRLLDVVGRPSLLTLELETARGARSRWRAPRAMLSGGAGERVARIRVAGEDVQFRFSAVSQRP